MAVERSVAPTPGQEFLRQALGSNQGDMRLPSILLSAALAAAVIAWLIRRARPASSREDPGGDPDPREDGR